VTYGPAERRAIYETLNEIGSSDDVDFVLLGCPHASVDQIRRTAELLDGRRLSAGTELWIMAPRSLKVVADRSRRGTRMSGLILQGRTVVPGSVEGEALVSHEPISGWGGIDPARGVIIEPRHKLFGVCFAGKILVFPSAKGSSGWSGFFQTTRLSGTAPIGMVIGLAWSSAGSRPSRRSGRW
jgi:hypothetical protein